MGRYAAMAGTYGLETIPIITYLLMTLFTSYWSNRRSWTLLIVLNRYGTLYTWYDGLDDIAYLNILFFFPQLHTVQEAAEVDCSIRSFGFSKLIWSLKILTLDQPAGSIPIFFEVFSVQNSNLNLIYYAIFILTSTDIRRYTFPSDGDDAFLTDDHIRLIMSRRVEFSKDAVAKVKIGR